MKKLKELMKGYRVRTFNTPNGKIRVEKQLAHWFEEKDDDLVEHYFYLYELERIEE